MTPPRKITILRVLWCVCVGPIALAMTLAAAPFLLLVYLVCGCIRQIVDPWSWLGLAFMVCAFLRFPGSMDLLDECLTPEGARR